MIFRFHDAQEALAVLKTMVAAEAHPVLNAIEVQRLLLDFARRTDSENVNPTEEGWLPTYDLAAAAAEGWRQKAGKAAGDYDFQADESSLKRGQVVLNCLKMSEHYTKQIAPFASKMGRNRRWTPSDEFEALIFSEEMEL